MNTLDYIPSTFIARQSSKEGLTLYELEKAVSKFKKIAPVNKLIIIASKKNIKLLKKAISTLKDSQHSLGILVRFIERKWLRRVRIVEPPSMYTGCESIRNSCFMFPKKYEYA